MKPQLATEIELQRVVRYVEDPNYAVEQKVDGHRLLLTNSSGHTEAIGRNGTRYGHDLPIGLRHLSIPEGWAVDGELVGSNLHLFDALPLDQSDLPLSARRDFLEQMVRILNSARVHVVPQAREVHDKARLIQRVIREHCEGVVIKHLDAGYTFGRSDTWLKAKITATLDAIVLAVRDDGKESMALGVYDHGTLVDVARASLIGKERRELILPGDVVEVRYLYAADPDRPRLIQPRMLRKRRDKVASECSIDQLRFANKTVLV